MNNPLGWREVIIRPFKGWVFFLYLTLAFLPWAITRQILIEEGVILGGLLSTALLFLFSWLIGISFILFPRMWRTSSGLVAFYQRNRKTVILGGIFLLMVAGWTYYKAVQEERWACLKKVEYAPAGFYFNRETRQRFGTQKEALEYCLLSQKDGIGYRAIGQ